MPNVVQCSVSTSLCFKLEWSRAYKMRSKVMRGWIEMIKSCCATTPPNLPFYPGYVSYTADSSYQLFKFYTFLVVSSKFQRHVSQGLTKSNGGEWIHCFVWWEPVSQRLMSGDKTAWCPVFVYVYNPERSELNEEQLSTTVPAHCARLLFSSYLVSSEDSPCTVRSDDIPKVTALISSFLANLLLWKF